MREVITFALKTDAPVDVSSFDFYELFGERYTSDFGVLTAEGYLGDFSKYNGKRVRLTGTFDYAGAGWRNYSGPRFRADKIELVATIGNNLVGTKWTHYHDNQSSGTVTCECVFVDNSNMTIINHPLPAHRSQVPTRIHVRYVYEPSKRSGYYIATDGEEVSFEISGNQLTFYANNGFMMFVKQ